MGTDVIYFSKPVDYKHFYDTVLKKNVPSILGHWATSHWQARNDWTDASGFAINISKLLSHFKGNEEVSVSDCSEMEFGTHPTHCVTVQKYHEYFLNLTTDSSGDKSKLLYLKDWHFFRDNPEYEAYITPECFSSDWMNEFWDFRKDVNDDFRFVYFGPCGTWTPLHADVYRSFSWSANIAGEKRWFLIPKGNEAHLRDSVTGKLPSDLRQVELPASLGVIQVVQKPGEIIFVPSGWFHQVINISHCLSVNHNWLNACNLLAAWYHLHDQLDEVERDTADVRDTPGWAEACQDCLKAYAGINYFEFFTLVKFILTSRLLTLLSLPTLASSPPETHFRTNLKACCGELSRLLLEHRLLLIGPLAQPITGPENWLEREDVCACLGVLRIMLAQEKCLACLGEQDRSMKRQYETMASEWLMEEDKFSR